MKQRPSVKAVLGVSLFIAGFVLYIFTAFWIFSLPLLLIGAVLLLLTDNSRVFKLTVVAIPVAYVGISFYNSFTTPATYLIPEGYKGTVMVVFNQKDGRDEEYEGHRRIYKIPSTGILFTKFKTRL